MGAAMPAARLQPLIENAAAFCKTTEDRLKVWPTNRDRPAFNEVMAAVGPCNMSLSRIRVLVWRMLIAFSPRNAANGWCKTGRSLALRAEAVERTARELLEIVVIDLTANENAQEIFETLNARGAVLTAADLIKNFVFQRLLEKGEMLRSPTQSTGSSLRPRSGSRRSASGELSNRDRPSFSIIGDRAYGRKRWLRGRSF